jgi:cobalt-precorrin-5B (C1)-methyltransferase
MPTLGVLFMGEVGVVLIAHGSRGENANDGLFETAQALRDSGRCSVVEVGFMQRNFPTIEEAAGSCINQGAGTVLLVPYFLHAGLHLQHDIPEVVDLLKVLHPTVRFAFGKPFAHHPKLLDIVLDRIDECQASATGSADTSEDGSDAETAINPSNSRLRTGYTTGACAAAAAKAAAEVLMSQQRVIQVEIGLPTGERARMPVGRCEILPGRVRCSVIKDAGDDPDVTNHAEICASVEWQERRGIVIEGGEGVGVITKPGLELPVGSAAINPVPRRMIQEAVREALGDVRSELGVRVVITVPAGKGYAKRTLNHRLGIVGGISILGTTGIVIPFSSAAYTASVSQALGVAVASGCTRVVLTTGRRTERFAQSLVSLPDEAFIQVGDFMDFALEECVRRRVTGVTLCVMIGKLSKLAAGHLQTHVSNSAIEQGFLSQVAAESGADPDTVREIAEANTGRHFAEIVQSRGFTNAFDILSRKAAANCSRQVEGRFSVECLLVDFDGQILGRSGIGE